MDRSAGELPSVFDNAAETQHILETPKELSVPAVGLLRNWWSNALLFVAPTPELGLAAVCALIALLISQIAGLPFSLPDSSALAFTGMHPAVPFGLIAAWAGITALSKHKLRIFYYLAAFFSYLVVLIVHFNVKLWMNIVNPVRWDGLYWQMDQAVRPLIDMSFRVHEGAGLLLPFENHLYLFAFLMMFVASIIVHSTRCFIVFRRVIFTAMLVHALGAFSYLIMPAVGPFLYEAGHNALETARQVHMYDGYQALMAGGRPWIAENGGKSMLAAVAAMPSLHVASSGVFLYYAWKHERWLGICYLPLFTFILFEAMATRWHYAIDLVAGIGLTALAIWICSMVFRPIEQHNLSRLAATRKS
jgi:hypothetical protein